MIRAHIRITTERQLRFWLGVMVTFIAAYLTHIVHCIAAGKLLFLVVGAVVPPVAMVHGLGLWFGAW